MPYTQTRLFKLKKADAGKRIGWPEPPPFDDGRAFVKTSISVPSSVGHYNRRLIELLSEPMTLSELWLAFYKSTGRVEIYNFALQRDIKKFITNGWVKVHKPVRHNNR